jgi:hypothetical protein
LRIEQMTDPEARSVKARCPENHLLSMDLQIRRSNMARLNYAGPLFTAIYRTGLAPRVTIGVPRRLGAQLCALPLPQVHRPAIVLLSLIGGA